MCAGAGSAHAQTRGKLAPWEKQISEVQGRVTVAQGEADLLQKQQRDASKRLEDAVRCVRACAAAVVVRIPLPASLVTCRAAGNYRL